MASGSIPIVAGFDGKPDYLKFMPKNSFINVYDYTSMDDLVGHLTKIQNNKNEYEKYLYFKRRHSFNNTYLHSLDLHSIIKLSKFHFKQFDENSEQKFFSELILKEKSENKLCKIARYLKETPLNEISRQIEQRRMNRIDKRDACLMRDHLVKFVQLV